MSFTPTTNYSLQKIGVGTEIDAWGDDVNTNMDLIDTRMKLNADAAAAAATAAASKANAVHTHPQGDIINLSTDLAGKAPVVHAHTIAQVDGLSDALAGKSPTGHSHVIGDVTGLSTALSDVATKEVQSAQSTNYTLVLTDAGKMVTFSGAAAVTVPTSVFVAGHRVDFINLSAGVVSFTGGTLRSYPSGANKLSGQYAGATIYFLSASEYVLVGNIKV